MGTLTDAELEAFLSEREGWASRGVAINKDFAFRALRAAMAVLDRVAERAEAARHHPDIEIHYNHVQITLSTHDAGGVTEKDVAAAVEIDAAAEIDAASEPG